MRWLIALALILTGVALATLRDDERPPATVGHTGVSLLAPTTTTTTAPPTTTTTAKPTVATSRSSTVVTSQSGGVTILNEGSAAVSTGGNITDGGTVVTGAASAVGNVSRP
jgi:hypothetical protein